MKVIRRTVAMAAMVAAALFGAPGAHASQSNSSLPQEVLRTWYQLSLELVRHTPTYSPPVASRALAYLGVTAFEAVASGSAELAVARGAVERLAGGAATRGGRDLR